MKNKILTITIVFLLISLTLINNVFAFTEDEIKEQYNACKTYLEEHDYTVYDSFVFGAHDNSYMHYYFTINENSQLFVGQANEGDYYVRANYVAIFIINPSMTEITPEVIQNTDKITNYTNLSQDKDYEYHYSSFDVLYENGDVFFSADSSSLDLNGSSENIPDYDEWYDSIFNSISDWVGTLLEMLVNPFGAIADGIVNLGKHFSGVLDFLNPTSENFILKQVWDFLTNIISYLNPFSENFFAYKLVELLLDGLKGLFVPSDYYFSNYFNELNNWFSERLGFLYYPLELLFDLLNRMLNINFESPVINIPDIKEPTTNITLIKATSFNFNNLLDNSVFSNVHNIYLLIVDAGIYIGLVMLLMKKYEEVMTK